MLRVLGKGEAITIGAVIGVVGRLVLEEVALALMSSTII